MLVREQGLSISFCFHSIAPQSSRSPPDRLDSLNRVLTYHHSLEQHGAVYVPNLADWSYHWGYRISRCLKTIYLIVSESLLPSV
jgi:hypothetical protein